MESAAEVKILQLLDVLSVEVAGNRTEMRGGFNRVERRLGNLEVRVEDIATELRSFRAEFERRITPLEELAVLAGVSMTS